MRVTYIVKFNDNKSRDTFIENIVSQNLISKSFVKRGEFLPDVILLTVPDDLIEGLKQLAGPNASFTADFQCDPLLKQI